MHRTISLVVLLCSPFLSTAAWAQPANSQIKVEFDASDSQMLLLNIYPQTRLTGVARIHSGNETHTFSLKFNVTDSFVEGRSIYVAQIPCHHIGLHQEIEVEYTAENSRQPSVFTLIAPDIYWPDFIDPETKVEFYLFVLFVDSGEPLQPADDLVELIENTVFIGLKKVEDPIKVSWWPGDEADQRSTTSPRKWHRNSQTYSYLLSMPKGVYHTDRTLVIELTWVKEKKKRRFVYSYGTQQIVPEEKR